MILKAIYHPEIHLKSMHEIVQSVDAYKISIDGAEFQFAVSATDEFYPSSFGRYRLLWKLRENAYDYEYCLYCLLRELYNIEKEWSLELQDIMQPLLCYEQSLFEDGECFKRMAMVLRFLKQKGFIQEMELEADFESKEWKKLIGERRIGLCLIDLDALNAAVNRKSQAWSLKDEILLILNTQEIKLDGKYYILTNEHCEPYLSFAGGKLGGHLKLHIYGSLDCPSALRHLAKGHYKKNRIFFANEEKAVAAGFRPCAVCMQKKYIEWKNVNPEV